MNTLKQTIQKLQTLKESLSKKYHISYLAIFGSVSRNENTKNSDIDILVDFTQPVGLEFIDLADELEKILDHKVDLVSRNGIKPEYYEQIKNDLQYV
jgi:hypothetical protein